MSHLTIDAIELAQSRTFRETHKEKMNLYCACALVVRVMASFRQILRKNDSPDDDSRTIQPEKRDSHECALVDDHLHLFGGRDGSKYVPRNEIFVMNVRRAEKKWIRRLTRGRTIPPPCYGARYVVIDKMIYSYGGRTEEGRRLGIVYRLDPKKMEWIEVYSGVATGPVGPARAGPMFSKIKNIFSKINRAKIKSARKDIAYAYDHSETRKLGFPDIATVCSKFDIKSDSDSLVDLSIIKFSNDTTERARASNKVNIINDSSFSKYLR